MPFPNTYRHADHPLSASAGCDGSAFIPGIRALPIVLVISALSSLLFYWRILPIVVPGEKNRNYPTWREVYSIGHHGYVDDWRHPWPTVTESEEYAHETRLPIVQDSLFFETPFILPLTFDESRVYNLVIPF